ncbi:MAG TPA: phage tail sheath C-terminal domain-containing protein, partial [Longimicrobiales bacterium]
GALEAVLMVDGFIEEQPLPAAIAAVPTSIAAFIGRTERGPSDQAVRCLCYDDFLDAFGGGHPLSALARSVRHFFANGGRECYIVRISRADEKATALTAEDFIGTQSQGTGLHAFDVVPRFNLLIVPRDAELTDTLQRAVAAAASRFCFQRHALLLLDAPHGVLRAGEANTQLELLHDITVPENVAIYYPDIIDAEDEGLSTGPSGAVAGIMTRLDERRGVWKAAAGADADLYGNPTLTTQFGTDEIHALVDACVNPLRVLNGQTIIWGARTLAARSNLEWKYVPVRRLLLFLEASIEQGLQWAVFENNDEVLWSRVRRSVESFLFDLWRQGALLGTKAEQAFFVKCGRDTMTQNDIDAGRLIVLIGVAPLKPAEFVIFAVHQTTASQAAGIAPTEAAAVVSVDPVRRSEAADALATQLGRSTYRIDVSRVVSKYIGETEKILGQILARAETTDVLLFFDEADALFGTRSTPDQPGAHAAPDSSGLLEHIRRSRVPVVLGFSSTDAPRASVTEKVGRVTYLDGETRPKKKRRGKTGC